MRGRLGPVARPNQTSYDYQNEVDCRCVVCANIVGCGSSLRWPAGLLPDRRVLLPPTTGERSRAGSFLWAMFPISRSLIRKGDNAAKDASVCAAKGVPNESLVVDAQTKGIANVIVYMPIAKKIHPDLMATPANKKELEFDQIGCRFFPHVLFVRTDQTVLIKSSDPIPHNIHTNPIKNSGQNFITKPNQSDGGKLTFELGETYPVEVKCDIHTWMKSYWVILDHPYAAVTDSKGNFTIANLPAEKNTLRIWHERAGWLNKQFTVDVKPGKNQLETISVPSERFIEK